MTLPIYHIENAPTKRPPLCNAGLWFERFFDKYDNGEWKVRDEKTDWLKNNFNRSSGDNDQLEAHALNQLTLAKNLRGRTQVFATQWHFVTGMGNPHPVENGLSWHPTLGAPYLTGATVKGIVRNWLEIWDKEEDDNVQKQKLLKWFGSTGKDPSEKDYEALTGEVIFFDAFPVEAVTMNVDIMTPHMGKWYEKGGDIKSCQTESEKVPADWHDPTPIPFLVVKEARFLFSVAPRNKRCTIEMDKVMEMLGDALSYMGAGSKTAVGYGVMEEDTHASSQLKRYQEERQEQERLAKEQAKKAKALEEKRATMSPIQREVDEVEAIFELINMLEAGHWEGDDAQQAAGFIKSKMQQDNSWNETTAKKKPEKDKPHQRTLTVMKYL